MFYSKKGFTMIELLVVLLIIGVLAAVAAPMYLIHTEKARASEAVGVLSLMRQAERENFTKHNVYLTVASGNVQNEPENAAPGLGVTVGASQYFGNACYTATAGGTFTSPPSGGDAKDFVLTATGSASNGDGNVRVPGDVTNYIVQMDNSGSIRYTADGTTWKNY